MQLRRVVENVLIDDRVDLLARDAALGHTPVKLTVLLSTPHAPAVDRTRDVRASLLWLQCSQPVASSQADGRRRPDEQSEEEPPRGSHSINLLAVTPSASAIALSSPGLLAATDAVITRFSCRGIATDIERYDKPKVVGQRRTQNYYHTADSAVFGADCRLSLIHI